jgi:hypothetical protein
MSTNKTMGLRAALAITKEATSLPLSASLTPSVEVFPHAAPKTERQYKDRKPGTKGFMAAINITLYKQMKQLSVDSERTLGDLTTEAFNDLLEKYRAR